MILLSKGEAGKEQRLDFTPNYSQSVIVESVKEAETK